MVPATGDSSGPCPGGLDKGNRVEIIRAQDIQQGPLMDAVVPRGDLRISARPIHGHYQIGARYVEQHGYRELRGAKADSMFEK